MAEAGQVVVVIVAGAEGMALFTVAADLALEVVELAPRQNGLDG